MKVVYTYAATGMPAPYLPVSAVSPTDGKTVPDLLALVDSGADRTVLPQSVVDELQLEAFDHVRFEVGGGDVITLPIYRAVVMIHDFPPIPVDVAASAGEENILLGRDVLNAYSVLLNGPKQLLEITDE